MATTCSQSASQKECPKQLQLASPRPDHGAGCKRITHAFFTTVVLVLSFLGFNQQAQAHTTITKTTSTPTVVPGGTATYTINVTDAGTSSATSGITVTDALPTGFTYLSTTSINLVNGTTRPTTVNPTAGTNTPSWGTFNTPAFTGPVNSFNITFNASVPIGGVCGKYDNSVSATTTSAFHTYTGYTGTGSTAEDVTVTGALNVTKTTSTPIITNTPTRPQATYTLVVTNPGQCTIPNVNITDALPTGFTYASTGAITFTGTATRPSTTNPTVEAPAPSWGSFTIPGGGSVSLTFTANVATTVTDGTYNNSANANTTTAGITINSFNGANSTAEDVQVVSANLAVTKTTSTPTITNTATGAQATYAVTVTNSGTGPASSVKVTDTLPAGFTYGSTTSVTVNGTAVAPSGYTVTGTTTPQWDTSPTGGFTINAGQTIQIVFTANVANTVANGIYNNSASVTSNAKTSTNFNGATSTTENVTVASSNLTITKSHTGNFTQGQIGATYALTATNSGTAATSGTVSIVDTLPAGLTATAINGTGWACTLGTLTCTRSDALAAGASYPAITLTVTVASNAASIVTNSATVSGGGEINTTNNSATDPTTVVALADLRLSKIATPASPSVGGNFTYTITVTNDGPSPATNVQVTDRLPVITEVVITAPSITTTQGSTTYNSATPSVLWTVGTLAPNASATLTIPATRLTPDYNLNVAEVTASDQPDPDSTPSNNVSGEDDQSSATVPEQLVDMAVTKTVDNPTPNLGQPVVFTISVTNTSTVFTATGVGLRDVLPAGLTYQSSTPGQGVYNPGTGVWSVGSLSPGSTATLTITATVNASGSITNTAQLSALDQSDSNSANNSGNAVLTASAPSSPKLILVKRITAINASPITTVVDPATTIDPNDNAPYWPAGYLQGAIDGGLVRPGDELEYTIYFLSDGDSIVKQVQLCDLIPTNSTFSLRTFDGLAPTDGGLPGADSGIAVAIGPTTTYLSNVRDTDRGEFFVTGSVLPASCSSAINPDGAVVVNVVTNTTTPSNLPNATSPGNPTNSYGFIRFRAKVN